jgi:7-carboxy-7-deazaguanine synthase
MIINEVFYSLQGEGFLAGVPSVFIRIAGCPLRCTWCDTKYALDPASGEDLDIEEIVERIERRKTKDDRRTPNHVVITGGEPMVNPQLGELSAALREIGKHITIETSGIVFANGLACDLMSISPKTSNSGTKKGIKAAVLKKLVSRYPYQLKFVVDSAGDLPEIQRIIRKLGGIDKTRIILMPQARTRKELIAKSPMVAEMCKQAGFSFCNRLQILLYNGKRGK